LEESYTLLDDLYADFLACFSSRYFNVCSDETYDLGTGRSKDLAAQEGMGRLYLGHIKRLHELATRYDRTMMVWDDIFLHYPELLHQIPSDAIMLNWEYEAAADYPQVEGFHQAGLRQIVCPGTSSWNTLFPRLANARGNIRNFIAAGSRVGAIGVLTTDWGDGGHYNMLGLSWYPYAYSAAEGWGPRRLEDEQFERRFAALSFGPEAEPALAAMRLLAEACSLPAVFRHNASRSIDLFFDDPLVENSAVTLPDEEQLARMSDEARERLLERRAGCTRIPDETLVRMLELATQAGEWLAPLTGVDAEALRTLDELRLAAREVAHAARKGRLARQIARIDDEEGRRTLARALDGLKRELHLLRGEHERLWLARSKPEGLWISLDRFDRAAAVLDGWRRGLATGYRWNP
ncbi:MAG TPA: family 20 glycosylhydrolase, partial [Chloroflexota bacterium]|nr:family 20 glycosylhydrolase [Chloroflexota bacterium]